MNINEYNYISPGWTDPAEATLDEGFNIMRGNYQSYRFLGRNSTRPVSMLVHPDEREFFIETCDKARESGQQQNILVRIMNAENHYSVTHLRVEYEYQESMSKELYQIEINDIIGAEERSVYANENMKKYRLFMSMMQEYFLEYNIIDDKLQIYQYQSGRAVILTNSTLSEWKEQCLTGNRIALKDRSAFDKLCDNLKSGKDEYVCEMKSNILSEEGQYESLKIRCRTMYKNLNRYKMVGVINVTETEFENEVPYYLTEAGKDPATGVYNKRATMEYAIERLEKAKGKRSLYMSILDIDNFKVINDRFGHMFGDEVIERVADIVREVVGTRGIVGRFGGDGKS